MISLTMFVVFVVVVIPCFACAMGIAMSPAYDAGDALWYAAIADSPAPFKVDPRIGALTMCEVEIPPCIVKGESSTLPRIDETLIDTPIRFSTLTDTPAIVAPSYMGEGVQAMIPRIIGDARNVKGQFMPRYKS